MIKREDLQRCMCHVNCGPLPVAFVMNGTETANLIAAGPFIKDGEILKRVILRALPKGDDGVEFVVHTQYTESSYILPNGKIDAFGAPFHLDQGDYATDFVKAMKRFTERCMTLAPILEGVSLPSLKVSV